MEPNSFLSETMKKHIDILLEEFETDDDLLKILPSVSAQIVKDVNEHLSERAKPQLPESAAKNLEEQGRRRPYTDIQIGAWNSDESGNCESLFLIRN